MKRVSKYQLLTDYLRRSSQIAVSLTIAEIEAILGFSLPPSARTQRAWWSNRDPDRGALQAAAWRDAGYHVVAIALDQQQITFRKTQQPYHVRQQGDALLWNGELIKALRLHAGWSQAELAEKLHLSRQQTISEWETGLYAPGSRSRKDLDRIAKESGFTYQRSEE